MKVALYIIENQIYIYIMLISLYTIQVNNSSSWNTVYGLQKLLTKWFL